MSFGGSSGQADAYRNAIPGVYGIANFNIGVINNNLSRSLGDLALNMHRTTSTQRAQMAKSGFSVGSKSFQMLHAETINDALSKADDLRQDADLERQRIWYEAQVEATNLENRARAAEYQSQAQSAQQMFSIMRGIGGALGG